MSEGSVVAKGKFRLFLVLIMGSVSIVLLLLMSLAFGPVDMSFSEAMGALTSAFGKWMAGEP